MLKNRTKFALAFAVSTFAAQYATATPQCPILKATYSLKEDESFTAGFSNMNSRKETLLYVRSPADANSDVKMVEGSSKMPLMSFYEIDENLRIESNPASALPQAPQYLFSPQIGSNLFYFIKNFGAQHLTDREDMPRSVFQFKSCRQD